ncbi:cystathionine beta-lyase family protein involved in aluminum resistance [Caldalkalibacillus uzonensis]|uniref:Cystathionine beta-lyase family protein involved in aluminum resistance n=1 Tax=Caldalkalibacillus uzonensis TaxID=353224 RepID=A0ABU0CLT6_9BACI|nr:methionine gamma-lyase family protein [Caldalkalibacillus uzonensis]MDQ0337375.1 cystathionine beta-lyase family protein involved in aluminum resistance [Caldalkalibacillus uzonensis]
MNLYEQLSYGKQLQPYVEQAEAKIRPVLDQIRRTVELNQWKVLHAFRDHEVGDHHFAPSTGYGYDDMGREILEKVYATIFHTEAAIVRPQLISGTHAIATCLFGLLRPGDELVYITGKPYDTLEQVIGQAAEGSPVPGSLADFGIGYQEVSLTKEGEIDPEGIQRVISERTKVIGIQRSRGYADRPSFNIDQIQDMITLVRKVKPDVIIFVDNCYGEFVEEREPTQVGADIMAGSLIKNPGGGLVRSGGYIVGKQTLIERVGTRLFAPGIGLEGGANLNTLPEMYQGLFLAPHIVGEALKGAIFSSALLADLGFQTTPVWDEKRTDLIQSIQFNSREKLIAFCQGIQKASPINAHVVPYPSPMPGYEDEIIMAAGTFIQGASIELSADGPLRPPYLGFVQGGLTYEHVKIGILTALNELLEKDLLNI